MSHTDYGDIHRIFAVEDVADKIDQHLHVVAFLGIAREPDQHQIPTHLHSRNAVNPGQHVRKNVGNASLWQASSVRRYSLSRSIVFSGIPLGIKAISIYGNGEVRSVAHTHPVLVDMVGPSGHLLERIRGLQRRVAASLHIVLDVGIHRRNEDHRRIVTPVRVERRQRPEALM